jgi:2-keto-4-pentenoate hydratase
VSPEAARSAAELLLQARGDHRKLDRLPEDCTPTTVAEGDAIQDALAELWGLEVAGWKVGAASEAAMAMLKTDAPFAGRVFAPYLLESPAEVSVSALHKLMVECEFAFRLGRDLPPRDGDYAHDEVVDAVDMAYPAIEVINDYWVNGFELGVAHLVADNGSNGGLVLGPAIPDWRDRDLAAHHVTLSLDGEPVAEGQGSAILGHPLNTLVWLANDLSKRGIGMTAGQVTTTGTMTGMTPCQPGQTAKGDYGDAGTVQVTFVA